MNKRQKENLLKLANFLEKKVPNSHFNLAYFVENTKRNPFAYESWNWKETHKNLKKAARTGENIGCGAVGCAIGFCPVLFPRSFKYEDESVLLKRSERRGNFDAAQDFFGLSRLECTYLFSPGSHYKSKKTVVKRLKRFAKDQRIPDSFFKF